MKWVTIYNDDTQLGINLQHLGILDGHLLSTHSPGHGFSWQNTGTTTLGLTGGTHDSVRQRVTVGSGLTTPTVTFHSLYEFHPVNRFNFHTPSFEHARGLIFTYSREPFSFAV